MIWSDNRSGGGYIAEYCQLNNNKKREEGLACTACHVPWYSAAVRPLACPFLSYVLNFKNSERGRDDR